MGRLQQVSRAGASAEVQEIYEEIFGARDPVKEPGTATGTPGDFWTTYALAPDLLVLAHRTLMALLRPGRRLDAGLRELAILRTGIVGDSRFEYSQHLKMARSVGVSEEKLDAIKAWAMSTVFSSAERAVMAATDEILSRNLVEDQTFAALKRELSDPEIMELFFVVGTWRMHGLIVRALHLEYDDDTTSRMQEIPAPTGAPR